MSRLVTSARQDCLTGVGRKWTTNHCFTRRPPSQPKYGLRFPQHPKFCHNRPPSTHFAQHRLSRFEKKVRTEQKQKSASDARRVELGFSRSFSPSPSGRIRTSFTSYYSPREQGQRQLRVGHSLEADVALVVLVLNSHARRQLALSQTRTLLHLHAAVAGSLVTTNPAARSANRETERRNTTTNETIVILLYESLSSSSLLSTVVVVKILIYEFKTKGEIASSPFLFPCFLFPKNNTRALHYWPNKQ